MKFLPFAKRNLKEIFRDPLSLIFSIALPMAMLLLFALLFKSIPNSPELFSAEKMTPGILVFGYSFIIMFEAMLIVDDKKSAFLPRLLSSPMTSGDFILGYCLPMLAMILAQTVLLFVMGLILGMPFSGGLFLAALVAVPEGLFCIFFGVFIGSLFNKNQVTVFSNIVIQLSAILGGVYFDLGMVGGAFKTIGYILPFANAVDAVRAACSGDFGSIFPKLLVPIAYAVVFFVLAIFAFKKKAKN